MILILNTSKVKPFKIKWSSNIYKTELMIVERSIRDVLSLSNVNSIIDIELEPENTSIIDKCSKDFITDYDIVFGAQVDILNFLEKLKTKELINRDYYFGIIIASVNFHT